MQVANISTITSQHTENLKSVFQDLIFARTSFHVTVSVGSTLVAIPFNNGTCTAKVENAVLNLLQHTFG